MFSTVTLLSCLFAAVSAQLPGPVTPENHPKLNYSICTRSGGCTTHAGGVVLDANYRWQHNKDGYVNCQAGNTWNATFCPDAVTCAQNCVIEGADYNGTYAISTVDDALTLGYLHGTDVGSRVYLMADDSNYQVFKLKNQEFTFDVDVSSLPCGVNGALYFSEMEGDGGSAKYPNNKAGAKYGTGYCDAQCPSDVKFQNGEANFQGYGACCSEMDIWEANSVATAYTPHTCSKPATRCLGVDCGNGDDRLNGLCDKEGCDFNSYRMGDKSFYGPGNTVDTNSKFTVVTQFFTSDNTTTGTLSEIRRIYVQNGKVIQNSKVNVPGVKPLDSITDDFCAEQKTAFGGANSFADKGGLKGMGDAFDRGMVLVLSLWDDFGAHMLWLDSTYPVDKSPDTPGVARGPCATTSGNPTEVRAQSPDAKVIFSNIKVGDINTTFG